VLPTDVSTKTSLATDTGSPRERRREIQPLREKRASPGEENVVWRAKTAALSASKRRFVCFESSEPM
jgi:hypothetical protein